MDYRTQYIDNVIYDIMFFESVGSELFVSIKFSGREYRLAVSALATQSYLPKNITKYCIKYLENLTFA